MAIENKIKEKKKKGFIKEKTPWRYITYWKRKRKRNIKGKTPRRYITYWFGTNGVVLTLGCTTCPIAKIPPPFTESKQWANILFTFPEEASCESIDEFDCPKPSIPSTASLDEPKSPDCWAPHLWAK